MVATTENEMWCTTIEGCNEILRKPGEVAESKQQEMDNLKVMLEDYNVKIAELESALSPCKISCHLDQH